MAKAFLLLVLDHDKKQFTVEGPMTDDTGWNNRVVAAKDAGREVNCSSSEPNAIIATVISDAQKQFKYKHVPPGSIV